MDEMSGWGIAFTLFVGLLTITWLILLIRTLTELIVRPIAALVRLGALAGFYLGFGLFAALVIMFDQGTIDTWWFDGAWMLYGVIVIGFGLGALCWRLRERMDRRRRYKDVSSLIRDDAIAVHRTIAEGERKRLGRGRAAQ